ncbi:MAG TPA: histidine kinase [Puia sp.]|nr:histidine kinase [Puia sp.]
MNARTQQILLHVAGCVVVLALPLLFSPEDLTIGAYLTNPPTQREIFFNALVIGVFYINYYGLIPKLYFTRRYLLFLLINMGGFFAINFMASGANAPRSGPPIHAPMPDRPGPPAPDPSRPAPRHSLFMDISQHLFVFLVVLFLALLLKIRERLKQAEKEKLQAELSYLKAQINPHFLFNMLNSIYALTIERSDKAPDAVTKLSGMMRYAFSESGKEMVALGQELDYIRNYIALQEFRFGSTVRLDYHIDEVPPSPMRIAPLILIPFIENAFKHGINPEEDSEIRIRLTIAANDLHLEVYNKKVPIRHTVDEHSGLGIANTRQRLALLYPHAHTIDIEDNKGDFRVFVTLQLTVSPTT